MYKNLTIIYIKYKSSSLIRNLYILQIFLFTNNRPKFNNSNNSEVYFWLVITIAMALGSMVESPPIQRSRIQQTRTFEQ